jgi:hypothetical protein
MEINDSESDLTELDNSDEELVAISEETRNTLSERAKKYLKQTSQLAQSYFCLTVPFLLRITKHPKKVPFLIEHQTFARSNSLMVTSDSGKKIICLIQFHPLDGADSVYNQLSQLIEELHIMASHRHNLKNKKKLLGRMSGIGFRGGFEKGKSAVGYFMGTHPYHFKNL